MELSWPILLLLLVLIWMIFVRVNEAIQKYPPSCVGVPVFGRLPMMALRLLTKKSDFYSEMASDGASKGDVWSTFLGMRRVIGLTSYEAIHDALSRQGIDFAWRPRMTTFTEERSLDGSTNPSKVGGIAFSSGDLWREHRRFALSVMRDLGMGKNLTERKIQTEARCFNQELLSRAGAPFDPNLPLTRAVSNIISQFVFGFRSSYETYEFDKFNATMKELVQEGDGAIFLVFFFPALENTFLTKAFGKMYTDREKEMIDFIDDKIAQVEAQMESDSVSEPEHFVDAFLRKQNTEPEGSSFCRKQLIITVYDLFAAGSETTSTFLNWALIYLSVYPDWQKALHEEIDDELGSLSDVSYSDRLRCHKTMAFIDEIQRHASLVPHNVPHAVGKECFFRGYRIPEDAIIIPDIRSVHYDPALWPQPKNFDPKRFLSASGEYQASKFLIPFGIGKRACLGESLARMEIFIFLASILRSFEVQLDEEAKALGDKVFMGSVLDIHAPKGHKVIISARKE